jgi:hypothetical protein
MDAIQGAGGTDSAVRSWAHAAEPADKATSGLAQGLSREYVSLALRESGFVDICAGSLAATPGLAEGGPSDAQTRQTDLDVRIAGEVAAQFGQQVAASSIEAILEIMLRPDPKYVIRLLRQ